MTNSCRLISRGYKESKDSFTQLIATLCWPIRTICKRQGIIGLICLNVSAHHLRHMDLAIA
jgi:hypothetical protein